MSPLSRRAALIRFAGVIAGLVATAFVAKTPRAQDREGRVVDIEAKRFRYTPNQIVVKRGEVVTLAFRSLDFVHGFSLPDFGIRADLIPGRVTQVRLQPMQAGRFTFMCDNFCGDGHEEMNGTLIVET